MTPRGSEIPVWLGKMGQARPFSIPGASSGHRACLFSIPRASLRLRACLFSIPRACPCLRACLFSIPGASPRLRACPFSIPGASPRLSACLFAIPRASPGQFEQEIKSQSPSPTYDREGFPVEPEKMSNREGKYQILSDPRPFNTSASYILIVFLSSLMLKLLEFIKKNRRKNSKKKGLKVFDISLPCQVIFPGHTGNNPGPGPVFVCPGKKSCSWSHVSIRSKCHNLVATLSATVWRPTRIFDI